MSNKRVIAQDGAPIKTPANGEERGSHIKAPAKPTTTQSGSGGNKQSKK